VYRKFVAPAIRKKMKRDLSQEDGVDAPLRGEALFMGVMAFFLVGSAWLLYQQQDKSPHKLISPGEQLRPAGYVAVDMQQDRQLLTPVAAPRRGAETGQLQVQADRHNAGRLKSSAQESTWQLAARIVRLLVLDEVESFVRRAQLVAEVGRHAGKR
jgi:hypothetical protein